jgi:plasmid maintenance system antidote protein VapI
VTTPKQPMTEALRKAIADSGLAHIAIERATGVKRGSIARFLRGERSLRLDLADRLAAFFGLEVRAKRKGK